MVEIDYALVCPTNFVQLSDSTAHEKIPTGESSWQTEVAEITETVSETSKEKDKYMLTDALVWIQKRARRRKKVKVC